MRKGWILILLLFSLVTTAELVRGDDTDLFIVKVPPDGLIVLDLSGSMRWTPPGQILYVGGTDCSIDGPFYGSSGTGHTNACSVPQVGGPIYGDAACLEPFYKTSSGSHTTECGRVAIAKRVIFDVLDDNNDGKIDSSDETSLGIRMGYMRFYNCGTDTGNDYTSGCNTKIRDVNSSYATIWDAIKVENGSGGTALAFSLNEARLYFDATKGSDTAAACRRKFVILITDGEDTLACGGVGMVNQPGDYKRRRETVAKAKKLVDAGYLVFVVGFGGTMPHYLRHTLNWTARFGGTDNPLEANTGNLSGYDPSTVTSCQDSTELSHNLGEGTHYYATSNDPGEAPLSGYAFLAENASQLGLSLSAIIKYIQEKSYSFTAPTIPLVRILDKDVGYISFFIPNDTPFWKGNLKAYQLDSDGTLAVDIEGNPLNANLLWDAYEELKKIAPGDREIHTHANNAFKNFVYANLTNADLDVSTDSERADIINHIRGIDAFDINGNGNTTEIRDWKLGDIFHSNAVIVGSPSQFFEDTGFDGPNGFYETNKNRTKVILVGANDGMLHAFNASTGAEKWAFIPNSVLKTLKFMRTAHTYYVDSSAKVADVWIYSDPTDATKTADEWKTVLVCGLRKGGKTYFALDITDTLNPKYLWEFPKPTDATTLAKVGQSWSEPSLGRVKIEIGGELYERWVAFIGGGYDTTGNTGRAFFVVDLKTGDILWEYSYEMGVDEKKSMTHSLAAPPTLVDTNSDGYVEKVYIADLGGQMWVFDVSFYSKTKKSDSLWNGKRLFQAPGSQTEKHPVYYQPAVAFDRYRIPWVYFGTGDRENPKDYSGSQERFYAVKDDGLGSYPRNENDLADVTSNNTFNPNPAKKGWYIKLEKGGQKHEKILAKPAVFNRLVYFTTYTYTESTNPCTVAGEGKLYIVEYLSGGGALTVDELTDFKGAPSSERSKTIGSGVPSAPVITVNLKGKASLVIGTTSGQVFSKEAFSPAKDREMLYWREIIR